MAAERLLTVQLARHRWGLRLPELSGVCEVPALRALPGVTPAVLGLAHRHGRIVTVLDLPALLQDEPGVGAECLLLAPPRAQLAFWVRGQLRLQPLDLPADEQGPLLRLDLARLLAPLERAFTES